MKKIAVISSACALGLMMSSFSFASAFQSFEQSASGLGDAYAGAAAQANDSSTEYYNPAGMVRLNKIEMAFSTVVVDASTHYVSTGVTNNSGTNIMNTTGKHKYNPLGANPLPAFHLVIPLPYRLYFGFGVTVPFGLQTDYPDSSDVRYFATESQIMTVNINPSLAYKLNKHFSVGAGIDFQYLSAELDQQVDYHLANPANPTDLTTDSSIQNRASDWGIGWNAGLLYQFTPNTRIGLTYRSPIVHHPNGDSHVKYSPNLSNGQIDVLKSAGVKDGHVSSSMVIPSVTWLSLYHQFTPAWSAAAGVSYTHWRRFKKLTLHFTSGLSDASEIENFHSTFRYAIGTNYRLNKYFKFRLGTAYDKSPTTNKYRTVRLPDADRIWLTLGTKITIDKYLSFDLGYGYVHIARGRLDQSKLDPTDQSRITGKFRHSYANLFGAQINVRF